MYSISKNKHMELTPFTDFVKAFVSLPDELREQLLLTAEAMTPEVRASIVDELKKMEKNEGKIVSNGIHTLTNDVHSMKHEMRMAKESKSQEEEQSLLPSFNS